MQDSINSGKGNQMEWVNDLGAYVVAPNLRLEEAEKPVNKYLREIKPGVFIDFYDIADAFEVHDSAMAHALKKILAIGKRGHKTEAQDRKDIFDSVVRSNLNFNERSS